MTCEYNSNFNYDTAVTIKYNSSHVWDVSSYYGTSTLALYKLGEAKGYNTEHFRHGALRLYLGKTLSGLDLLQSLDFSTAFPMLPIKIIMNDELCLALCNRFRPLQ